MLPLPPARREGETARFKFPPLKSFSRMTPSTADGKGLRGHKGRARGWERKISDSLFVPGVGTSLIRRQRSAGKA